MKKITFVVLFFGITLLSGCSSDSEDSSHQTISFKMNGVSKTAVVTSAILYNSWTTQEKWLEIVAQTNENTFMLRFFNVYSDDNGIPIGNYISTANIDNGIYLSYRINGNNFNTHYLPDDGILTLTSVNSDAKKATGTFHQVLHAVGHTEDFVFEGVNIPYEINITDGVFTSIRYTVAHQ